MADLVLGPYDSKYFAELFATGDTEILPQERISGGEPEEEVERKLQIQRAKKQRLLNRLVGIKSGVNQAWFRDLETALMRRVRMIESKLIWEAMDADDFKKIRNLEIERMGIVRLFETFKNLSVNIDQLSREIEELSSGNIKTNLTEGGADPHLED